MSSKVCVPRDRGVHGVRTDGAPAVVDQVNKQRERGDQLPVLGEMGFEGGMQRARAQLLLQWMTPIAEYFQCIRGRAEIGQPNLVGTVIGMATRPQCTV